MQKENPKQQSNPTPPDDFYCKCGCGKIGFVYVEKLGQYLCRDRYIEYNREQLAMAARFFKRKV